MNRRRFLLGAGLFVAAPAVIRTPGLLMPIRATAEHTRYSTRDPRLEDAETFLSMIFAGRLRGVVRQMGDRVEFVVTSIDGVPHDQTVLLS